MTIDPDALFRQLDGETWQPAFHDAGDGDWRDAWRLDGKRATVTNSPGGMIFSAGPVAKDDGSHAVLWTQESFRGDLRIEFEFERLDTINRYVNILYIQATGTGDAPYGADIDDWAHLRHIPRMNTYFCHMNLIHISYAAFGNDNDDPDDYVRMRRYPVTETVSFDQMAVPPDYEKTGLFLPGETYQITVMKKGHDVAMEVAGAGARGVFAWNTSDFPLVEAGRIGIRHMYTRCSRYKDFTVKTLG